MLGEDESRSYSAEFRRRRSTPQKFTAWPVSVAARKIEFNHPDLFDERESGYLPQDSSNGDTAEQRFGTPQTRRIHTLSLSASRKHSSLPPTKKIDRYEKAGRKSADVNQTDQANWAIFRKQSPNKTMMNRSMSFGGTPLPTFQNDKDASSVQSRSNRKTGKVTFSMKKKSPRNRSQSPPPPPPPLPERASLAESRNRKSTASRMLSHQQEHATVFSDAEITRRLFPKQEPRSPRTAEAELLKTSQRQYAASISQGARQHRSSKNDQASGALLAKIESLECALEKHKENEQKLQHINVRLQDRLIVFQKQNSENVRVAKERIQTLETQLANHNNLDSLRRVETSRQQLQQEERERFITQRRIFRTWTLMFQRRRLQHRCNERRQHELLSRVLRSWACAVLFEKLCSQARYRKLITVAENCFVAWREFVRFKLFEGDMLILAEEFHRERILLRRQFRHWKELTRTNRKRRDNILRYEEQIELGRVFTHWSLQSRLQRKSRLHLYFSRWKSFQIKTLRGEVERLKIEQLIFPLNGNAWKK